MRIIQLSDLHLSSKNRSDLNSFYLEALILDLKNYHDTKPIDLIIVTGDLVDKGGESLGQDPYKVFFDEFVSPICAAIGFEKERFLFIPGNHDIDRNEIDEVYEQGLLSLCTKITANHYLAKNKVTFSGINKRIEKFKQFEKNYHEHTQQYHFSNNESVYIHDYKELKIGIVLINDSWRCSENILPQQHFVGTQQLLDAKTLLDVNKTDLNIVVFHHPLNALNESEVEEIENILNSQKFHVVFFGHTHKYKFESILGANGGYIALRGRSALNHPHEYDSRYQPGYNIVDLDITNNSFEVYARKFIKMNGFTFDKDVDSLKNGYQKGQIIRAELQVPISSDSENKDTALPDGYTANVERIVRLLIGKALYPNPLIFVRELIQNSVDACERKSENGTRETSKILVSINGPENYIEVHDQGDGMTKKTLSEHFAIIGKSISQDFNDSNGHFNLISRFGIGFISTFIAAHRVAICTKHDDDEFISFEILDVFKSFNYKELNEFRNIDKDCSGTTVRVYLKNNYRADQLTHMVTQYCRHIKNLEIAHNGNAQYRTENWNIDQGKFFHSEKNTKYEYQLTIGSIPRPFIASNSGFLINQNALNLLPVKFPYIIYGEVNFCPRAIDFDMSRSNIIESEKSREFRKDISGSLRILFRAVLESGDNQMISAIMNFVKYYYVNYDQNLQMMQQSYKDFYSKRELLNIILENSHYMYMGVLPLSLHAVVLNLKNKGIKKIYIVNNSLSDDHENIFIKYLEDNGNFLVRDGQHTAQCRDGQVNYSEGQLIRAVAAETGLEVIDLQRVTAADLNVIKQDKNILPVELASVIEELEVECGVKIDLAKFDESSKQFIRFRTQYFLNYNHRSFQSLLSSFGRARVGDPKLYLLGLLGLAFDTEDLERN